MNVLSFKDYLESKNIEEQYLNEMTIKLRGYDDQRETISDFNKKQFNDTKHLPTIENHLQPKNCKTHVYKNKDLTEYYTNNHKTKENLHRAFYTTNHPSNQVPISHIQQHQVDRDPDVNKLPKGYAGDFAYERFKEQDHPFVTSNHQFETGHNLWRKLTQKALEDEHHVYYHDGKTLHKTDKHNIYKHLDDSYGTKEKHLYSKMIISKRPL